MKLALLLSAILACVVLASGVNAYTKSERCSNYAHNARAAAPTTTGPMRGAARGAVGGAIFGNAGRGAAIGAAVGTTRHVVQKNRSYQYYYDSCMSH